MHTKQAGTCTERNGGGAGFRDSKSGVEVRSSNANDFVGKPSFFSSPRYPEILRTAGIEGDVFVSFVVDTTGRVDVSPFVILQAAHPLLDAAVRAALPGMRFLPAEVGGRMVRQLAQQSFVFHIIR